MSMPHSPTIVDSRAPSAPEIRTVWLFARPLRSSFFDWLSRGDLVLCHWGLLLSDISIVDLKISLQSPQRARQPQKKSELMLGRMYELGRMSDGKIAVVSSQVRWPNLTDDWPSFAYQIVSTTGLLDDEIESLGMAPFKLSLMKSDGDY